MKKIILLTAFYLPIIFSFAQVTDTTGLSRAIDAKASKTLEGQSNRKIAAIGDRIALIVGFGPSVTMSQNIYDLPSIDQTTGNVKMQTSQILRTNMSIGISYTPYFHGFNFGNGDKATVPWGLTYVTYINPIKLSGASNSYNSTVDLGIGLGFRTSGNVLFLLAVEFYSVKQPQEWFKEKYITNKEAYILDGQTQKSINYDDNNIFYNKFITTISFKIAYTFDLLKSQSIKTPTISN